jgi:PKD repeat protein
MKKLYLFLIAVSILQLNAQVNLNSSLTACYALNGNGTEPINNLTGTLSAAVTATVDRFNNSGKAVRFPGTLGTVIQLPDNPLIKPSNEISMSVWVKPELLTWMEIIYTKNTSFSFFSAYALTFQDNGSGYKFRGYRQDGFGDNYIDAATVVTSANVWYHVVFTIDSSNMNIYVNGNLENTVPCTITNYNYQSGKNVIIGGTNESASDFPFIGSMDNLRFYNRVINAAEVSALYNQDPACLGSAPNAVISVSSVTACVRDTVFLNDASANNPTSWSWTMTGGNPAASTASNPAVVYNTPGIYTVSLVSTNQFGSSSPAYQTITVVDCDNPNGIKSYGLERSVRISPNPCADRLHISFLDNVNYNWELTDITGRKVKSGKGNSEIEMNREQKGLYFLIISNNRDRLVKKIIKE